MATSTSGSEPEPDENAVNMVTVPIVDTDNVSWSRLLNQPGLTFQSIPVLDANGQPITVNVNTIDSHIQVSASGITTLPTSGVAVSGADGQNTESITSVDVVKTGSHGNSYTVSGDQLSSVFSEGMQVSIVSTQEGLPATSCVLQLMESPYQQGDESAYSEEAANVVQKEDGLLQTSDNSTEQHKSGTDEIFSSIQAILSESILEAIINTSSTFLDDLQSHNSLIWQKDENALCVSGKLSELLWLQHKLVNLFRGKDKDAGEDEEVSCTTSDKCIQTDPPAVSDFSTMCDILVPSVSTYGRGIRQPARFNQYSFMADAEDSLGNDEERQRRMRRKRKADHRPTSDVISSSASNYSGTDAKTTPAEQIKYLTAGSGNSEGVKNESEDPDYPPGVKHTDRPQGRVKTEGKRSTSGFTDSRNPKKKTRKEYESQAPFKFFCKICSFKSKRESHFVKHTKLHTTSTELYECTQCDFKTIRCSTLKVHEICHSKFLFNCDFCKYRSTNSVLLGKHISIKHRPEKGHPSRTVQYFRCQQCSYKTVRVQKFASHLESHGPSLVPDDSAKLLSSSTKLQCEDCNYKTCRKEHLARHRKNVHCDLRPFLCDLCGCSFKRADTLTAHKVTHVDKKYRRYQYKCEECDKDFRSRAHLLEHKAMHSTLRSFLCDICGVGFKRKSCQQKHMKSIHLNPRSFQCQECNKGFNTKYALLRHKRTHDTALLLQVDPESQVTLQQIQISHTFQCSECDKTFNDRYSFLRHMQTHDPTFQIPAEDEEQESLPQMEAQIATFEALDGQTLDTQALDGHTLDTQALDGQTQELSVQDIMTGGQVLEEYDQNNLPGNEAAIATIYLANNLPLM